MNNQKSHGLMTKQEEKVKVMCSYCQKVELVEKSVADKLDETTAYCCEECLNVN